MLAAVAVSARVLRVVAAPTVLEVVVVALFVIVELVWIEVAAEEAPLATEVVEAVV